MFGVEGVRGNILIGKAMDPALNMTSGRPQKCQKRTQKVAARPGLLQHTRTCICGSVGDLVSSAGDLRQVGCRGSAHSAWTLELLTRRHHSQHKPFITMVPSMMEMAGIPLLRLSAQDGDGKQTGADGAVQLDNLPVSGGKPLDGLEGDLDERCDHDDREDKHT